jgi:hypothetical protein
MFFQSLDIQSLGFRIYGLGLWFRDLGLWFSVYGLGTGAKCLGLWLRFLS